VFNANTDTLTIADDTSLQMATGDFSLDLWFRWVTGTVAQVGGLVSKFSGTEGYKLEITDAGLAKFTFGDADESVSLSSTTVVTDGWWHHICVTVDRSEKTGFVLYVDGVAEATSTDATADPTDIEGAVSAAATDLTMTGIASVTFHVSNLGIYKAKALSAAEVATLFGAAVFSKPSTVKAKGTGTKYTGEETSVVVAMPLDEGTGTVCYNMVSGTVDGTLSGVTFADDGVPFDDETLVNLGPFVWATGVPARDVTFPHPIKIGRKNPIRVLETDGSFNLILFGCTKHA